jgi:hypothetical protein
LYFQYLRSLSFKLSRRLLLALSLNTGQWFRQR